MIGPFFPWVSPNLLIAFAHTSQLWGLFNPGHPNNCPWLVDMSSISNQSKALFLKVDVFHQKIIWSFGTLTQTWTPVNQHFFIIEDQLHLMVWICCNSSMMKIKTTFLIAWSYTFIFLAQQNFFFFPQEIHTHQKVSDVVVVCVVPSYDDTVAQRIPVISVVDIQWLYKQLLLCLILVCTEFVNLHISYTFLITQYTILFLRAFVSLFFFTFW